MYLPDTNVLLTRFLCEDGVADVTDFMPVGDVRHAHAIVRRLTCARGPLTFQIRCAPRFDYGRAEHDGEARPGEVVFRSRGDDGTVLRLRAGVPLEVEDGAAVAEVTLQAGETVDFILEATDPDHPNPADEAGWVDDAFNGTVAYWRTWGNRIREQGRWSEMLVRSALAIKLLTSSRFGSIAAAGTFGLPEMVGGERNWDYRYTWIRDGSLTAAILVRLGYTDEPRAFLKWVEKRYSEATEPGKLQIMYGIDGRHDIAESTLDHFEGYRNSAPVRVGNAAYDQVQLDIYGELLYLAEMFDDKVEMIAYDLWCQLSKSVDWVCANWRSKDEGIWEVRGGQQEFLYSRLVCWVAVDRALRIAERRALPAPIDRWRTTRDEIHDEIYHGFWNDERAAFVQHKAAPRSTRPRC